MWWLPLSVAFAQELGQLQVVAVDDEDGLPVHKVTLTLSGEALIGGVQERLTDESGVALFTEIPPGLYRVEAAKSDFGNVAYENIQVHGGRTTQQLVRMREYEIV
jgi:hypothetical protein